MKRLPARVSISLLMLCLATVALSEESGTKEVEVFGQPRVAKGHPCTLWDQDDIAQLKKLLTTSPGLQAEFGRLKQQMDQRIAQPLGVPEAAGAPPASREWFHLNEANVRAITDLGTMYALTGDAKYGEFCRKMLVAYARNYPRYPHRDGWTEKRYRSAQDGRLTGQFLTDGFWLIQAARGYDLVYNLPSWTADERQLVRDDLFEAIAYEFVADILGPEDYLSRTHNRSVVCNCGVLMAGYASDDEKLIRYGLYGKNGTKEKPTGGVFGMHFGPQCIDVDGMWNEGAMGYQFLALASLINDAEMLWRHGMDLYRYRHGALKGLFDSPLKYAYPDLTLPATHDSGRHSLLADTSTDCQHAYEYAWLRYRDPRYPAIINQVQPHLHLSTHQGPTSIIFDRNPSEKPVLPCESANFSGVGYGVLRLPTAHGTAGLILEYGPSRSHGHPSKLGLDVYALGDVLLPDPGFIFPYDTPLHVQWYKTTPSHNVLVVDQKSQLSFHNLPRKSRDLSPPAAEQTVYGPAATMGLQRAVSSTVQPSVTQDRAVFFTPEYLADLYSAVSSEPHTYDLAWHIRGQLATDLPLRSMQFVEPAEEGYCVLKNVRHTSSDQAWSATVTRERRPTRLLQAAAGATEVIVGDGYYRISHEDETTPAIYERRTAAATLYGNVVDFSAGKEAYVRNIVQQGGPEAGYGLLQIETSRGRDLCFAAYRPGAHQVGGLETDAQQAFVAADGQTVRAMYLAVGTKLRAGGAVLRRETAGLACVERLPSGNWLVTNPSPDDATIVITLPRLNNMTAHSVSASGQRGGLVNVVKDKSGGITLQLKPSAKVEFTPASERSP